MVPEVDHNLFRSILIYFKNRDTKEWGTDEQVAVLFKTSLEEVKKVTAYMKYILAEVEKKEAELKK